MPECQRVMGWGWPDSSPFACEFRTLQSELRKKYGPLPLARSELDLGWLALASVEDGDSFAVLFRSVVEAAEKRNAGARWIGPEERADCEAPSPERCHFLASRQAAAKRAAVAEGEKLLGLAEAYRAANQLDRAFVAALLVLRRYPDSASAAKAGMVLRHVLQCFRPTRAPREYQLMMCWSDEGTISYRPPPEDMIEVPERFTPGLVWLEFGSVFPRDVEEFRAMIRESNSPNRFGDGIAFKDDLLPIPQSEGAPNWLRLPRSLEDLLNGTVANDPFPEREGEGWLNPQFIF